MDAKTLDRNDGAEAMKPNNCATRLIDLGGDGAELFHDERGDGYALVNDDIVKTYRLRSKAFRGWISRKYWERYQNATNNEALQSALAVLEAKATHEGKEVEMHNRFAVVGDAVYIDLCDEQWQAVNVTAGGWKVVSNPGFFRRYSHQRPLPSPVKDGRLDGLDGFLNVSNTGDRMLIKGWLSAAYF